MSDNLFGAAGMHEAEADDPGIVYRHGWTHLSCPECADIIYDGRQIDADATEQMRTAHGVACTMKARGSMP